MRAANTLSPGANRLTDWPTVTTSPATSDPRMGLRGPVKPTPKRRSRPNPRGAVALRRRQSAAVTVVARTWMSTSLAPSPGLGTSAISTTEGGP